MRADLTVIANTLKTLTATVQVLSDTLSGLNISNATTLNPHFNTVTAGDLYCLDTNGSAVSVETELATKASQAYVASSFVSKTNPIINGTLTIGPNAISFQTLAGNTYSITNSMLESLYTNYNIWKTSYPTVDLSPYVTRVSLTTTLGSTNLNAYVTTASLTTTLGSYARSNDLNSYVSSTALITTLGG